MVDVPPAAQYALAVDLGTGGPKVALVGLDGTIADARSAGPSCCSAPAARPSRTRTTGGGRSPRPCGGDGPRVRAAGGGRGRRVTSHWSGTVAVDAHGQHLMNAIIWMDSRGARHIRERHRRPGAPGRLRRAQAAPVHFTGRRAAQPQRQGPDRPTSLSPARAPRRLRGRRDVPRADGLPEPAAHRPRRASYDSHRAALGHRQPRPAGVRLRRRALSRLSGLDRAKLPELLPPPTVLGALRRAAAARAGLRRAGTPVVDRDAATSQSAAVGSGAVGDYAGHLYIGTSSWLSCHVPFKKTDRSTTSLAALAAPRPATWSPTSRRPPARA